MLRPMRSKPTSKRATGEKFLVTPQEHADGELSADISGVKAHE